MAWSIYIGHSTVGFDMTFCSMFKIFAAIFSQRKNARLNLRRTAQQENISVKVNYYWKKILKKVGGAECLKRQLLESSKCCRVVVKMENT